jgi:hypothetical protein
MLSGLGHNNKDGDNNVTQNNGDNDGDELNANNEGNEGEDNNNKKEKKRRKVKKSTQIVENLEQITTKLNEDFVVDDDLYFCRISTSIEQEAIEGLLMNKLRYKDDSLELLINKDDIYFNCEQLDETPNHEQNINIKSLCETAAKLDLYNSRICDDLNKFKFIGWNLDSNDDISRLVENLEKDRFDQSLNMLDLHEKQQQHQQQHDSLHLGFEGDDDIDVDLDIHNQPPLDIIGNASISIPPNDGIIDDIRTTTVADMTQLLHHTSLMNQSEYSYFNFDKLKLHDLPKHIKAFAMKLSNQESKSEIQQEEQVKSLQVKDRRRKEIPRLDLSIDADRSKFFKVTKKALFVSDRTIESRFDKTFHLESERELEYNNRQLFQIYHRQTNAKLFSEEAIEGDNNFLFDVENNNNQTVNAVDQAPERGGCDDDDDYRPDDGGNFDIPPTDLQPTQQFFTQNGVNELNFDTQIPNSQMVNEMVLDGDNLIKAPDQVNALYIQYAKKAKNIDAKKLKHELWGLMCANSNDKVNVICFLHNILILFFFFILNSPSNSFLLTTILY